MGFPDKWHWNHVDGDIKQKHNNVVSNIVRPNVKAMSLNVSVPIIFEWPAVKNDDKEHSETSEDGDEPNCIQNLAEPPFSLRKYTVVKHKD